MRSTAYFATRIQSRKQKVVVEHAALGTGRGENAVDIERNGSCDEGQIAGNARIVHV